MSAELVKLYSSVDLALKMNLKGITHADSIKHVDNCNSINWIVGHIVVSRNGVLKLMGLPPIATEEIKATYERGSKMMTDMGAAENLGTLIKLFDESQKTILEAATKPYTTELAEKITFSGFHESYHVGQVAIVRKLIGKESAIK